MRAGLPFGCLLTQIILQSGINITGEPKMKIQQPISKQTLMKSNAQLRRDDSDDEVPIPPAMPVGFPDMASSSQTVPPSEPEINFLQIIEVLAAIHGGMSTMQQSITSMQQEVHSSIIILAVVMMRMMRRGLLLWPRMFELYLFIFVVVFILKHLAHILLL